MQRQLADAHQACRDLKNQLHQHGQALLRIPVLEEALGAEKLRSARLLDESDICRRQHSALEQTNADLRRAMSAATGMGKIGPIVTEPVAMIIYCPNGHRHIDRGRFATHPHKDHQCETIGCGITWRVAKIATVGVERLYPIEPDEVPA